ncbi:MAG: hypothetical protein KC506_02180 [Nanoarchaeota archaeon]|nr:hypothetical protein [Nanoarchaeota archaeon]
MVSYVLLIVIAIALSAVVYSFLKLRIPQELVQCPDSTSLIITETQCDFNQEVLTVTLQNKGLFNIDGAFVRFSQEGRSVRQQINGGTELFSSDGISTTPLKPGKTDTRTYDISPIYESSNTNYVLEVQPAIFEEGKLSPCEGKIVSQPVLCAESPVGPSCGDGTCDPGEDYVRCPTDNCPIPPGLCASGHSWNPVQGLCRAEITTINEDGYIIYAGTGAGSSTRHNDEVSIFIKDYNVAGQKRYGYIEWDISTLLSLPLGSSTSNVSLRYNGLTEDNQNQTIRYLDLPGPVSSTDPDSITTIVFQQSTDLLFPAGKGYVSTGIETINLNSQAAQNLQSKIDSSINRYAVFTIGEGSTSEINISSSRDPNPANHPTLIVEYSICGDTVCSPNENSGTCSQDC